MRRALAAFLWVDLGWTPVLSTDGKPTLDPVSERELTDWMHVHLALTWAAHPAPWTVEAAVIGELGPPLNVHANSAHPLHGDVRAARAAFVAAARATAPR